MTGTGFVTCEMHRATRWQPAKLPVARVPMGELRRFNQLDLDFREFRERK